MLLAFSSLACCDAFETLHHYTEHNLDLKLMGFVVNVCSYHVDDLFMTIYLRVCHIIRHSNLG